LFIIE
jgi:hypothetical protein